jgi:hypothetical protein
MVAVRWTGFFGSSLGKLIEVSKLLQALYEFFLSPLDLSSMAGSSLARQEGKRAVAGSLELSVRHVEDLEI